MQSLPILIGAVVVFLIAYLCYGKWLVKKWGIDERALTPAHKFNDGKEFVPVSSFKLFARQFTSIAGVGSVIGTIIAAMFGWLPALLWLIIGGIFFGAVQDFVTLYASVKNEGKSIGGLIELYVGKTGRVLFLSLCFLFTLLLLAAFTDILANTFDGVNLSGTQAATSSMLYIFVAMSFGLFVSKCNPKATIKFAVAVVALVATVIVGMNFPLHFDAHTWLYIIFAYALIASLIPSRLLTQPREYLNTFLLLGIILSGVLGILIVNPSLNMPAFVGFEVNNKGLFPFLFVMIACGAVSGFHSLTSADKSSKCVNKEGDMLFVGYGAMLVESLLGIVVLICVCSMATESQLLEGTPLQIFAGAIGSLLETFGLPAEISACVVTMCVAVLALTAIDSVTQVGCRCLQELFDPTPKLLMNKYLATLLTLTLAFILSRAGYMEIWVMFGAANHLLASLVLVTLTVFLRTTGRKGWMLYVPITFMFTASFLALIMTSYFLAMKLDQLDFAFMTGDLQLVIAVALVFLAVLLIRQCSHEFILQAFIVGSVVSLFIVGTVFDYYNIIRVEKHQNIINKGRIAAWKSADRIEEYISANINSVNLAAVKLDELLSNKPSDAQIYEFLVKESAAIHKVFPENTAGLYGYINGKFFSGVNWTPPPDYKATERPWYLQIMERRGRSNSMELYDDLQTGQKRISLGKGLQNGHCVVATDVGIATIQNLVEESVRSGESDMQMIISKYGVVIAHSDINEVGKNYYLEKGTLGAKIIWNVSDDEDEDHFEFELDGTQYVAYSVEFLNDWHCVTIKNVTEVFDALNRIFFATIAVGLAIMIIAVIIMTNYNRRRTAAEKLGSQLWAVSSIYNTMHVIDLVNDTFTEVQNHQKAVVAIIGKHGDNCAQVIHLVLESFSAPESRKEIVEFVDLRTLNERMSNRNTITLEFLNAGHKWRSARFIVVDRLADGRISRAMFLTEDIDEQKREREQLNAQVEENINRILSISKVYVSAYEINVLDDTYNRIREELPEALKFVNDKGTAAQCLLKTFIEWEVDADFVDDVLKFADFATLDKRLRSRGIVTIEYMYKSRRWVRSCFLASRRDENGKLTHIIWLTQDITKEIKERTRLQNKAERALAASEAKSSFLSNMSHEIRTPINAVLGMNEMILRESTDKNILAYTQSVKNAGTTLLGLINDILDFSKIEAGKMEIIPVDYDVSSLLNDLVNMIRIKADNKGLSLNLAFHKDMPKFLRGDEVRIKQVVTNILTNAVKYTERGSVTFTIDYERIEDEPQSVLLKVSIKDTGIGIKPEDIKKLFSEFERIEEKRNRNIEGTGLGMNITKHLLEMMDSKLEVASVYGEGSTFSFTLKQTVIKWEPLGDYEAAYKKSLEGRDKYKEQFKAPNVSVLVVDDNHMNLVVFTGLLKHTGVKIDTASSGDEGLALAYNKKYDIIFFDHMMPKKDGIETLHELRAQVGNPNLKTPTICLTANAISGAREQYLAEGFDDYLTKPVDASKLEKMMIHYLPADKVELSTSEVGEVEEELPEELAVLQELDWLDVSVGMKNSGSVEAYLPLLKIFYTSLEEKAAEIESFYAAGDYANYTIKVHAIKSSARIIGAVAFGEEAQLLENAGKAGDVDYMQAHHEHFMETLRSFKEPLAIFFVDDESDKPEAGADLMQDVFDEIKSAADDMDSDRLQDVFAEMSDYKIPDDLTELWSQLMAAADNYDYDSILSLLDNGEQSNDKQSNDKQSNDEQSTKPEADADLMQDVFDEIKSAADDMDSDRLQDVFAEMNDYKIPDNLTELWSQLLAAADNHDYDKLSELLNRNETIGED